MRRLHEWCRKNRHRPVVVQHEILTKKLRGHDAYYGITGNSKMLALLRHEVKRVWRYWLSRRSHRARLTWERFHRMLKRFPLPPPRVVHSVYRAAKP
jgi:RNA-directed DNA polymerase